MSIILKTLEANSAFEAGRKAYHSGKSVHDNPHIVGKTKLGSPKFSGEEGHEWLAGYNDAKPARVAYKREIDAAASVDVKRFRRKSNRHYK
jgi:hypothetical protein